MCLFASILGLLVLLIVTGCEPDPATPGRTAEQFGPGQARTVHSRPNILWIVWDTVRRDRMSLYGHHRETTPNVDEWAREARVFTNCTTPGSITLTSHASMFTGLLPAQHGAHNRHARLDTISPTIAELLRYAGYDTYIFAANPFISAARGFTRGFEIAEHPWSPEYRSGTIRAIRAKLHPGDRSHDLRLRTTEPDQWTLKTSGVMGKVAVERWLDGRESEAPFFIFLNYMEAHQPLLPAMQFRQKMMTPEEVPASLEVDRTWEKLWAYTCGLGDYTEHEIDLTRKTYDACLAELDSMFGELLSALESRGALTDTVVVLTSDHGEHLGEHHMLDHQYSLYQVLLEVPLIVHYPKAFEPGCDGRPVMTFDLFPTLLRLAGVDPPRHVIHAFDLNEVPKARLRVAEYPTAAIGPLRSLENLHGRSTVENWRRGLRALLTDEIKYICGSDGSHQLYAIRSDPTESSDLSASSPETVRSCCAQLQELFSGLGRPSTGAATLEPQPDELDQLSALGYAASDEELDNQEHDAVCSCPP